MDQNKEGKNEIAVSVDGVSKVFKLPHEKHSSVKSMFVNIFKKKKYEKQHALKNVSFEINKGEFFGIVGRNGSGKSTLLKMIAGIYNPTQGTIKVNGSLTPFIELGVGFNPELTGRENVFLNGALLGFNRKEMKALYDEIVEFAELEKFMDQKLKNYSSGMQVRLAFSIAIRAQSDILLLDEVLAVGDAAFQQKCFEYFDSLKLMKKTVVLVTHDMAIVERYCDRAVHIISGKIDFIGHPETVSQRYANINENEYSKYLKDHNKISTSKKISIKDSNQKEKNKFKTGDVLRVEMSWTDGEIKNAGVAIMRTTGEYVMGSNTFDNELQVKGNKIIYFVTLNLGAGKYFIKVGFYGEKKDEKIDFIEIGPKFFVVNPDQKWEGIAMLEHKWSNK